MSISRRNERLELSAVQVTGTEEGKAGVYARLLTDREMNAAFDVRYFTWLDKFMRHRETNKGVIFDFKQLDKLIDSLNALREQAVAKGLK